MTKRPSGASATRANPLTPKATQVFLNTKRAFNDPDEEKELDWPADWRLPHQGEAVIAGDVRGIVSTIDFDVVRRAAVIHLR